MTTPNSNQSNQKDKPDPMDEAWLSWKEHDTPETRKNLLVAVSPQVNTALRTFAPGMEQGLLLQANRLAMEAARNYDPGRGMKFKSYVYQQLQPLQRMAGKRSNMVSLPERHIIESTRLKEQEQRFIDEKGYEPSLADLSDFTGLSAKRIELIRGHSGAVSESRGYSPEGDPLTSQKEDTQKVWCEYVYGSLPSMDQKIYEWRTGYGGAPVLGVVEIAKRLNTSPATVSNHLSRIISLIQEGMSLE